MKALTAKQLFLFALFAAFCLLHPSSARAQQVKGSATHTFGLTITNDAFGNDVVNWQDAVKFINIPNPTNEKGNAIAYLYLVILNSSGRAARTITEDEYGSGPIGSGMIGVFYDLNYTDNFFLSGAPHVSLTSAFSGLTTGVYTYYYLISSTAAISMPYGNGSFTQEFTGSLRGPIHTRVVTR